MINVELNFRFFAFWKTIEYEIHEFLIGQMLSWVTVHAITPPVRVSSTFQSRDGTVLS